MVKIYTKKGDKGTTSLYSGERVSKTNGIIEAIGVIDELQGHIGVLKVLPKNPHWIWNELEKIQINLINISSNLATTPGNRKDELVIESNLTAQIEKNIDCITQDLEPLSRFVLQGTDQGNAQAHVCRTICRRSERRVLEINNENPHTTIDPNILTYLNRLSDYFFTLARWFTNYSDNREIPYKREKLSNI
jgi:cob(I)alamin adenosyltransferase